jgi:hypothetical protein
VTLLLPVLCVAGCGARTAEVDRTDTDTRFDRNKSLFAAVATADRLALYEGLPHQRYESDLLKKELQAKKTVKRHGFPFYADELDVSAEDGTHSAPCSGTRARSGPGAAGGRAAGSTPTASSSAAPGRRPTGC